MRARLTRQATGGLSAIRRMNPVMIADPVERRGRELAGFVGHWVTVA